MEHRLVLLVLPLVLQIALPAGLLFWLWRRRPPGRMSWLVDVAFVAATIAAVAVVAPWTMVPRVARDLYAIATVAAVIRSGRRLPAPGGAARLGLWRAVAVAARAAIASLMGIVIVTALAGMRSPPGVSLDLACPFRSGTLLTVNGGNSALLNSHLATLAPDPRYAPWRGQSYGVDLVEVDAWGLRVDGLLPADPTRYHIYDRLVVAPCGGRVVSTANDRPDMPVPMRDPERSKLAGNHVLLDCGGVEVLLAHLKPGTVSVSPDEAVSLGHPLGLIGNSGNTTEPHLHLSAQRRQPGDALIGGEPVWITIGGDYLVRNERLQCR